MNVNEMIAKQKADKLVSLGYFEKEYGSEFPDSTHPYRDWVSGKYYGKVPLSVTDEQFEIILKIGTAKTEESKVLPRVLMWTGIAVYLICFIAGIIMGEEASYSFSFGVMLAWWAGGFLSGTTFLWMAEVLKALRSR